MDKSNEVKWLQPLNILPILVTCEALKLDKSNEVKALQLLNIYFIFVTFEVFKLDKSNEVKASQLLNIKSILLLFPPPVKAKGIVVNNDWPNDIPVSKSTVCTGVVDVTLTFTLAPAMPSYPSDGDTV